MTLRVDQRCENCWCFEPLPGGPGECRRYAPGPQQRAVGREDGYWPYVNVGEWCAEWSPKDREVGIA